MSKFYFEKEGDEQCFPKEHFLDIGVTEVIEAVKTKVQDMMYCKIYGLGERGGCGKECWNYKARNGVKGMCKNQGNLYTYGKTVKL